MRGVPADPAKRAAQLAKMRAFRHTPDSRARLSVGKTRHGHAKVKTATYRCWAAMLTRCRNPNAAKWKYYGGRGITVCDRWQTFAKFLADMGEKPEGLTLDRIDVNGNYEPGNCRWTTWHEQRVNQRPVGSAA